MELATYYYHDNSLHLIRHVQALYADILDDAEREFIEQFLLLSASAQQIYIRLLCRKGDLFRSSKLTYAEISNLPDALDELLQQRFIGRLATGREYDHHHAEIVALYTKPELSQWLIEHESAFTSQAETGSPGAFKKLSRSQLDDLADACCNQSAQALSSLIKNDVICLFGELEFTTFRLLYFGNLYQDFTDFVLRDLGIYRYENYRIDQASRGFSRREQLEEHLNYYHFTEDLPELQEASEAEVIESVNALLLLKENSNDEGIIRRLNHKGCELTRQLERLGANEQALDFYRQFPLHPARERICRILWKQTTAKHAKNSDETNKTSETALKTLAELSLAISEAPFHVLEKQFINGFLPALIRRLRQYHLSAVADRCEEGITGSYVWREDIMTCEKTPLWQHSGVEAAAIELVEQQQPGQAYHVENALILSVFGLFYWPVIFAPVTGAFFHEFQAAPVDLYQPDFLEKRQKTYQAQQALLDHPQGQSTFKKQVLERAQQKAGIHTPFVFWGLFDDGNLSLVEQALEQIPLHHWRLLFDYLWQDLKHHRNGLPDLLWLSESGTCGDYELIEVKGPGDSLQKNQKGWLEYFVRQAIPARVLYIREAAGD
ncbi:VRR-NUC domain-containing protein [Bacterioplanoides sp.]|uniref:VRR-NUC domain-containing protein n=1 Tax=Bacterioplanoides sp. TaxID=2066072 RepID=UPI003B0041C4